MSEPISTLAKIEDPPSDPMTLFKEYLVDAEKHLKETFSVFNLATCNFKGEVLNRTVVLRDHDDDGIVFVTERNSRKYQDIKENPNVSATFLWCYHKEDDPQLTKHQIRITGTAKELNPDQIQKIYESEPISYKIRSAICRCGEPVNWNELKASHDTIVKDFLDGKETLKQNDSYTVMHIKASTIDFYHSIGLHQIADRVVYRLDAGKWRHEHVFP